MTTHPVPHHQAERFHLALCRRLGLNPDEVSNINAATDGELFATVTITAHLPAAEVEDLFNGVPVPAPDRDAGRTIPARTSDPATSHKATAEVKIRAGTQRTRLLAAFWHDAVHNGRVTGLTDEEAARRAEGVSMLSEYAKRCSELRQAGYIESTGETRSGQSGQDRIVSRVTDKGREALGSLPSVGPTE